MDIEGVNLLHQKLQRVFPRSSNDLHTSDWIKQITMTVDYSLYKMRDCITYEFGSNERLRYDANVMINRGAVLLIELG